MTRFKELKRIESAIEHRDRVQLEWAANYCKMRLQFARLKQHQKHWRKIEQQIQKALENAK